MEAEGPLQNADGADGAASSGDSRGALPPSHSGAASNSDSNGAADRDAQDSSGDAAARAAVEAALAKLASRGQSSRGAGGVPLTAAAAAAALGSLSLHAHFHCDVCGADLTSSFRIRCAECRDFDLCLHCFCAGRSSAGSAAGKQGHLNSHAYIPVGRPSFPLFDPNWAAEEELLLLEGVSKYGFGNWLEVSELVSQRAGSGHPPLSAKSAADCEQHYSSCFLASPASPLPDLSKLLCGRDGGALTSEEVLRLRAEKAKQTNLKKQLETPPPQTASSRGASNTPKLSQSIVGYWPLRGDFDVEYDNDAELILADMEFTEDEPVQERQLKLQIIEIYNSKLDERIYRKNTIIGRGLLDVKSLNSKEKRRTREERDLHNLFKPLARFHSEEQQERLVQMLIEERRIRARLAVLHEWRSLGLKTAQDVENYEKEKALRQQLRSRLPTDLCSASAAPGSLHANAANLARPSSAASATPKGRGSQRNANPPNPNATNASSVSSTNETKASPAVSLSIRDFPGAKLLTSEELAFCENAQLPPVFLLLATRVLTNELLSHKGLSPQVLDRPLRLVVNRVGQLYDFYVNVSEMSASPNAGVDAAGGEERNSRPSESTTLRPSPFMKSLLAAKTATAGPGTDSASLSNSSSKQSPTAAASSSASQNKKARTAL